MIHVMLRLNVFMLKLYHYTLMIFGPLDHHIHGMKINNYNINSNNIKEFTCSIHLIIAFQSQMKVHCRRTSVPYCGGGGVKNYMPCDTLTYSLLNNILVVWFLVWSRLLHYQMSISYNTFYLACFFVSIIHVGFRLYTCKEPGE